MFTVSLNAKSLYSNFQPFSLIFSDYDLRFTEAQQIMFVPPTSDETTLSFYSWVFVPKAIANISLLRTQSLSTSIDIYYHDSLILSINRYDDYCHEIHIY